MKAYEVFPAAVNILTMQIGPTNTERLVSATHRLMQAERTGDKEAIKRAEVYQSFYERQVQAEGASARFEAQRSNPAIEAERQRNGIGNAHFNR